MTATEQPPTLEVKPAAPPWDVREQVGEYVAVLYWRSHIVGPRDQGSWNTPEMRVVSVGPRFVCCDLDGHAHPTDASSPFYYAPIADVFPDIAAAMTAAKQRQLPAPPVTQNGAAWPGR